MYDISYVHLQYIKNNIATLDHAHIIAVLKHWIVKVYQISISAPGVAPKGLYGVNFTGPTTIFMGWGSLSTSELQGRLAGYEVKYREFSVADEILENPGPELTKFIPSDVNGVRLTGLETYTTYQVRVAAASGGGRGVFTGILYIGKLVLSVTVTVQ